MQMSVTVRGPIKDCKNNKHYHFDANFSSFSLAEHPPRDLQRTVRKHEDPHTTFFCTPQDAGVVKDARV